MGLNDLKPADGSRKTKIRRGRGTGSGKGGTCGRGHKGQLSRAGGKPRRGFEGGQMPIHRRLPKRGFRNIFSKQVAAVNIRDLNRFEEGTEVTPELLMEAGLISKIGDGVKILAYGELEKPLVVSAHGFSKAAIEKIESAGGSAKQL